MDEKEAQEKDREIFDGDWKNHWCIYCDKPNTKCDCPEYDDSDRN